MNWLYVARESASMEVATRLIDSITGRFSFSPPFRMMGDARGRRLRRRLRSFSWANSSLLCVKERTFSFSGWHNGRRGSERCSMVTMKHAAS